MRAFANNRAREVMVYREAKAEWPIVWRIISPLKLNRIDDIAGVVERK